MKLEYRFANINDIDQLVRLRILMQFEVNQVNDNSVSEEFIQKVKNYFLNSLSQNKYHSSIAIYENQIIANAGVVFYEKPPTVYGGSGINGYVTNVYTEKKFRGRGIGTRLMHELNLLALKLGADKLHLGATNEGLSIYKAVGYDEPRFTSLEIKAPFEKGNKIQNG